MVEESAVGKDARAEQPQARFVLRLGTLEATLLAVATLAGYLLTFQFQKGYLDAFGVPEEFIHIGLASAIPSVMAIGLTCLVGIALGAGLDGLLTGASRRTRLRTLCTLGCAAPVILLATALLKLPASTGALAAIAFMAFVVFDLDDDIRRLLSEVTQSAAKAKVICTRGGLLFLPLILGVQHVERIGRAEAGRRSEFLLVTVAEAPEHDSAAPSVSRTYAVVQRQGNAWLCVEIDPETQVILDAVRVVDPTLLEQPARRARLKNLRLRRPLGDNANAVRQARGPESNLHGASARNDDE